jgi:GrpB-like predicted nucleotidyltransferase (UPF0157 family)
VSGPSDHVELADHDPSWAQSFEEEKRRLAGVFDGQVVGIEHVGSTSVPDLSAKPIVDMLVGLRDLELSDEQVAAMEELGYEYLGDYGLPGRFFFRKDTQTHHVHVVQHGGEHWARQLTFREALRTDAEERRRYDAFKRRLVAEGHPRQVYTELKTPFIRQIEARARARGLEPDA